MAESLGTLTLELEAKVGQFKAALKQAREDADGTGKKFNELAKAGEIPGVKTGAAALRTFGGAAAAINLASMSEGLTGVNVKAMQIAATFTNVGATVREATVAFGGLKAAMIALAKPVAAMLAGFAGVVGLMGSFKQLSAAGVDFLGIKSDAERERDANTVGPKTSMGASMFGTGFMAEQMDMFMESFRLGWGGEIDEMNAQFKDFNVASEMDAAFDDMDKASKKHIDVLRKLADKRRKAAEEEAEFMNELGAAAQGGYKITLKSDVEASFDKGLSEAVREYVDGLKEAQQRALQANARVVNNATKQAYKDYTANLSGIEPGTVAEVTDVGAPEFYNAMIDVLGDAGDEIYSAQPKISTASESIGNGIVDAAKAFGSVLAARGGEAGSMLQSAMAGFQATGGNPLGAGAAIIGDLVSRTEGFKKMVQVTDDTLAEMTKAMEPLAEALVPLVRLFSQVFLIIAQQIGPLFETLTPVFEGMFQVIKKTVLVHLYIIRAIGEIWNGIIGAIQSVFDKLGDIKIFGKRIFGFMHDWSEGMEDWKVNLNGINRNIDSMENTIYNQDVILRDQEELGKKAKSAMEEFTGVLNAPSGFKAEYRRFSNIDQMTPQEMLQGALGMQPVNIQAVYVNGVTDIHQIIASIEDQLGWHRAATNSANPPTNSSGVPGSI